MSLNLQQKTFCELYVSQPLDERAIDAAKKAGYAEKSIVTTTSVLLKRPDIQTYISELRVAARLRSDITLDRIIDEYAKVAFFDIRTIYDERGNMKPVHELDDIAAAAIASIEVERDNVLTWTDTVRIRTRDKLQALDRLRECLGFKLQMQKTETRDAQGNLIQTETTQLIDLPIVFK